MTTLGVTAQQLNELSKPIPKSLVKVDKSRGKPVSYITARTVMNWLDHAVGRANWKTEYRTILDRNQSTKPPTPLTIECTLSIYIDGQWVGKADVGTEDNYSPEKAAYSNALKRAGAQWGIARELYGEGNVHEEDADEPTPEPEQASEGKPEPAAKKRQSKPAPKSSAPYDPADDKRTYNQDIHIGFTGWLAKEQVFGIENAPHATQAVLISLKHVGALTDEQTIADLYGAGLSVADVYSAMVQRYNDKQAAA